MRADGTFFAIFISLFYLVGIGMLGYGLWSAWRSTQAAHWPTAPGVLKQVAIEEKSGDDSGPTYIVNVEYEYQVAGVERRGTQLAFGYIASSGYEAHAAICEKLKAATKVDVRYDPADPSVSVLSFGMHRSVQIMLAFAVIWLGFVVGFTLLAWLFSNGDTILLENLSTH